MRIVTGSGSLSKTLTVRDSELVERAADRLIAVLDDPGPGFEDAAFAVLAEAAGIARPRLRGWDQRRRRARLSGLRDKTPDSPPRGCCVQRHPCQKVRSPGLLGGSHGERHYAGSVDAVQVLMFRHRCPQTVRNLPKRMVIGVAVSTAVRGRRA